MTLLGQWREVRASLPEDWGDARLLLRLDDPGRAERANALLAPLMSGRYGSEVRFTCARVGGPGEEALRRAFSRLDRERIDGTLELVSVTPTGEQGHATTPVRTDAARPVGPESEARWSPLAPEWDEQVAGLPADWSDVYAEVELDSSDYLERGALLLGPVNPARDGERIAGTLELVSATPTGEQGHATTPVRTDAARPVGPESAARWSPLAPEWDEQVAGLPADWSDIYAEVELDSSDYLERGALLLGPVNPARDGDRIAFRFRCARTFGYGAPPAMVRRCLERLDGERITGRLRILRALSDTQPVYTQGPVWYVGGKAV